MLSGEQRVHLGGQGVKRGLGGGDNARPAVRGRSDGGIHRAAAQI